jgi:sec-independent protein translocase protein TatA
MFGIGMGEMIIILVVALIVLGPAKLPEIAKSMGKGYAEFIKAMRDVRSEVDHAAMSVEEEKKIFHSPGAMVERVVENTFSAEAKPETGATADSNAHGPAKTV